MLLQIHHAADLGGGGGHGAQSGFIGITAHRKDGAAPGGKVRVPCQLKGLPVLRHGAEAVQQRTASGGRFRVNTEASAAFSLYNGAAKLPQGTL